MLLLLNESAIAKYQKQGFAESHSSPWWVNLPVVNFKTIQVSDVVRYFCPQWEFWID